MPDPVIQTGAPSFVPVVAGLQTGAFSVVPVMAGLETHVRSVYLFTARKRTVKLLKEGFVTDTSSLWRTAYISALFEKDAAQLALRIAEADAAIGERLISPIEIGASEHEAILAARQALTSLKAQHVSSMVGETLM